MPSDALLKTANTIHRVVQRATFGKLGWRAYRMPVVELTTTGRRSGQPRTVLLTSPLQEGETIVVVGSRGGDDTHPAWFLNLRDHPDVEVALAGAPKKPYVAKVADANERARLWPTVETNYKGYAGYQKKTEREIPLVLLTPAR